SLLITEVLSHCQTCQGNTHTCSRRLVHLSEYHGCFIDNSGIFHLEVKVVSFTCTLSNTSKYGNTTMLLCDVVDQFLDKNCFTYTRTTEEADFTTLDIRSK